MERPSTVERQAAGPGPERQAQEWAAPQKWVGQKLKRLEDSRLVRGQGAYMADLSPLPDMHAAAILRIRLSAMPSVTTYLLPSLLRHWYRTHSNTVIHIHSEQAEDVLHRVRDGIADAGILGDFRGLPIRRHHYVVAMSHQLELDTAAVRQLLPTDIAYLGVLGSRKRMRRILEKAADASEPRPWAPAPAPTAVSRTERNPAPPGKLFAPVGLDIGAKTPQEITLSIMAELIAHRNGRSGGSLKHRE